MRKHLNKRFQNYQKTAFQNASTIADRTKIIDLSIGDTDFITDHQIIDQAMNDAYLGHTKYTSPKGDPELIEAIIQYYHEDYKQTVKNEEVFVTTSSLLGMQLTLFALLDPQDEVIVFAPYFPIYAQQIELAQGKMVEVATYEENKFNIQRADLEQAITAKTKAIIINSPNNPTGAIIDLPTYQMIADIAEKYDLIVIADEIYTMYDFYHDFIPFRSIKNMAKRTITLNSFSKNFMMTGWRIGYIIAPSEFIDVCYHINEGCVYSAPSVSQRAAIKALEIRQEIKEKYIKEYQKRQEYCAKRIEQIPYLSILPPQGTFYLFINIKQTKLTSIEFCQLVLQKLNLIVLPGNAFGTSGEGYIRFVCTKDLDTLKEAFDRLDTLKF